MEGNAENHPQLLQEVGCARAGDLQPRGENQFALCTDLGQSEGPHSGREDQGAGARGVRAGAADKGREVHLLEVLESEAAHHSEGGEGEGEEVRQPCSRRM